MSQENERRARELLDARCRGCDRPFLPWHPGLLGAPSPGPILDLCAECQPAGSPYRVEPPTPTTEGGK